MDKPKACCANCIISYIDDDGHCRCRSFQGIISANGLCSEYEGDGLTLAAEIKELKKENERLRKEIIELGNGTLAQKNADVAKKCAIKFGEIAQILGISLESSTYELMDKIPTEISELQKQIAVFKEDYVKSADDTVNLIMEIKRWKKRVAELEKNAFTKEEIELIKILAIQDKYIIIAPSALAPLLAKLEAALKGGAK